LSGVFVRFFVRFISDFHSTSMPRVGFIHNQNLGLNRQPFATSRSSAGCHRKIAHLRFQLGVLISSFS
jgi:hypothetical protein